MEVYLSARHLYNSNETLPKLLHKEIALLLNISLDSFYLISNGRKVTLEPLDHHQRVHIIPRVLGGKGGFGSMLRAIGAQIEKTTNREACRDLSGRRLRDINEEQRLKNWIATQADREKEAALRKRKKLEKLCEEPKHDFKDESYEKERSMLPDLVEDAVEQGLKAACCSQKRKNEDTKPMRSKNKKKKLWVDDELGSDVSSSEEEENIDAATITPEGQKTELSTQVST